MFIGVVLFGLFHGLLMLPVLLGLLGPASHRSHFKRSGIAQQLEIDDDSYDGRIDNTLDAVGNFDVDSYEHQAKMKSIADRISPIPLVSPPPKQNLQLFLNFQSSLNNTEILDITPSQFSSYDTSTQNNSGIIQESII